MTNTYKTLNPLGSNSPKDLSDNASNFDEAMNSPSPAFIDRFGDRRETYAGFQQLYRQMLEQQGYVYTNPLNYAAGIVISLPNQIFLKDGEYYRAGPNLELPYTTTGNWASESVNFVSAGDAVLRSDLASNDPAKGAYLVAGAMRSVASVAALRSATVGGAFDRQVVSLAQYASDTPGVGGGDLWWDASSTEADDGFLTFKVSTIAIGRWKRRLGTPLDISHAGAKPGVDCATAFAAVMAAGATVVIPVGGTYKLSTSTTMPKGLALEVKPGARLTLDLNTVLTVRGQILAPLQQVFFGLGNVVGARKVHPEWWGAANDGSGDSLPAFNAAYACMALSMESAGIRQTLELQGGSYQLSAPWVVTPTASCNFKINGSGVVFGGTRIKAAAGFPASPVVIINGSADTTQRIADFEFSNLGVVVPAGNAATVGIQLGNTSPLIQLSALQQNLIENVFVTFEGTAGAGKSGWLICHARLVTFRRCSVWMDRLTGPNNACIRMQVQGSFTGDMRWDGCQLVPSTNTGNYGLKLEGQGGAFGAGINQLAGLKFAGTDFYAADVKVHAYATGGSRISDVWFMPGCQWDGSSNMDVYLESNWNGGAGIPTLIDNFHFDGVFIFGGNLNPGKAQITVTSTGTGGSIRELFINDSIIGSAVGPSILIADNGLGAIEGVHLSGLTIRDSSAPDSCIEIHGRRVTCKDNHADRFSTAVPQHLIRLAAGSTLCIVKDNIGAGITALATVVNDAGTSTNIVADNL